MNRPTASLGMYDQPWLAGANDALWRAIAQQLRARGVDDPPRELDRTRPLGEIWRDRHLLLAQTCGYPLVTALRETVTVVAAPVYDLPHSRGATHCSLVLVPDATPFAGLGDLAGARAAINGRDSNTGMNLFRRALADTADGRPVFGTVLETGGHIASLEALRTGQADVAAIDSVTHALTARHRPGLVAGLRVLAATPPSPTLPFITRAGVGAGEIATLRDALQAAIADPDLAEATAALGLTGVVPARAEDYDVLSRYAREAADLSYPELA